MANGRRSSFVFSVLESACDQRIEKNDKRRGRRRKTYRRRRTINAYVFVRSTHNNSGSQSQKGEIGALSMPERRRRGKERKEKQKRENHRCRTTYEVVDFTEFFRLQITSNPIAHSNLTNDLNLVDAYCLSDFLH
jgi:hypothetical protein